MSLGAHLIELRNRFFIAAIAIVLGAVGGWFLSAYIWNELAAPVRAMAATRHATINFPTLTSAFDLRMQICVYLGIVLSSPIWLYEIFAFLTPGLTGKEKRYVFAFFFSAVPLFLAGCVFGWYVTPHIVNLFVGFAPTGDSSILSASDYFTFILKLVLAVGVAFVLPVFIVLLNMIGILSARAIIKSWRWAILAIVVFAALATPATDVVSMCLLAAPLVVLYFAAWFFAFLHDRRRGKTRYDPEKDLADEGVRSAA